MDFIIDMLEGIRILTLLGIGSIILIIILQIGILLSLSGIKERLTRMELVYNKDHNRYPQ